MGEGIHIALSAEQIGEFFGIPITNTLVTAWVVIGLLVLLGALVGRRAQVIPGKVQLLFETLFSHALSYIEETLGDKKLARMFFPLLVTLFLFIFTANALEFTPGIGSIGIAHEGELTPLLRSVNTDLNVTLALAVIAFLVIEVSGIAVLGFFAYARKFVNFSSPINFMVGIIELFSELARLVSFSFRLFGNIFAGEVLIVVAVAFVPYFLPVPLMAFELFVGFIQAAIFSLLTLFFIKIAITKPEH